MAKLLYQLGGGSGSLLNVYDDPQVLVKEDIQNSITASQEIRDLSDETKTLLAQGGVPGLGIPSFGGSGLGLDSFNDYIDEDLERLKDTLDYYDYDTRQESLTVRSGSWVVPISASASHTENGSDISSSYDQDYGSWWESDITGSREVIFQVRDYKKKMFGIRMRIPNTDERAQLQNVTIRGSNNINMIDDPDNIIDTGVNFTYVGNIWVEHYFSSTKSGKYLKLEFSGSLHSNPEQVRIRDIEIRVGIINHNK